MSYLGNLTLRLAAGAMRLPDPVLRRHAAYFAAGQNPDGGFSGREGPSDLYYTGFALRGLALSAGLNDGIVSRAAEFLRSRLDAPLASIDFLSLVFSTVLLEAAAGVGVFHDAGLDRRQTLVHSTSRFRREDGGYAKTERSGQSSTYHTFLAAACLQLVDAPIPEPPKIERLVRLRQRPDGGFVELDGLDHGGTNPTAAAIGLLRLLDAIDDPTRAASAKFLAGMQNAEGGLRAHARIPAADLLSTFAGLAALADLDALPAVDTAAARRYLDSLALPGGGFRGGAWDDRADLEYTFYGLGVLALLAAQEGREGDRG
jgi:geranylgeranyl transferase type-2 subunit beta